MINDYDSFFEYWNKLNFSYELVSKKTLTKDLYISEYDEGPVFEPLEDCLERWHKIPSNTPCEIWKIIPSEASRLNKTYTYCLFLGEVFNYDLQLINYEKYLV